MTRVSPSALLVSALVLLAAVWPAAAKPTDAELAAIKANCRSDFMSNCWGVKRGGAEAFQCLKEHMAKLSPGCQQAVKAAVPKPPAPSAPPPPQKTETAPPPEPTPAETVTPAAPPETPASEPAAAAATPEAPPPAESAKPPQTEAKAPPATLSAPPPEKAAPPAAAAEPETGTPIIGFIPPRKKLFVQRHCRQDLKAYCADVDLGEGRVLRCLLDHKSSLTPDCQGALAELTH